ncbi:hypothetical protein KA047_00800 [Candidatus Saccharibacteria bacterium]|nr:hypothetical protein [Candidatus Saccharibacteria bacterium]
MRNRLAEAAPQEQVRGIPMLDLADVYREHGPEVGLAELERRSICPPLPTSEATIDTMIRRQVGHFSLVNDYVELDH